LTARPSCRLTRQHEHLLAIVTVIAAEVGEPNAKLSDPRGERLSRRDGRHFATHCDRQTEVEEARRIDALFDIEREINGLSAAGRLAVRQERSSPLVAALDGWMRAERAKLSPGTKQSPRRSTTC
jgi:hypothetical protein